MGAKQIETEVDPENMSTAQAAKYLGIALGTFYNMRSRGEGPRFRKEGGVKYRMKDLDMWKNQKTIDPEIMPGR